MNERAGAAGSDHGRALGATGGARPSVGVFVTNRLQSRQIIRAELIGSNKCVAAGLIGRRAAPVLDLCRKLIVAGYDPCCVLHAYRDTTLCVIVASIGAAAILTVDGTRSAFARWKPFPTVAVSADREAELASADQAGT
jgi:hypothetical protein